VKVGIEPLLKLKGIEKSFAAKVLDNVSFEIEPGEIVALLGENGAGKSTLMKIISGIYTADVGHISFENSTLILKGPKHAQKFGINIIHQELNIVKNRTVAQNIYLGREPKMSGFLGKLGFVNYRLMKSDTEKALALVNARQIDPNQQARLLTTAQLQLVEIARALSMDSKIILMDEPTSSLTEDQSDILIELIKKLKSDGIAVVFTTHRILEAFGIADRFVILRDGKLVSDVPAKSATYENVIEWMVGRPIQNLYPKTKVAIGPEVLRVEALSGGINKKSDFTVYKGEILGFGGLVGAGRSELMYLLLGVNRKKSGSIFLYDDEIRIKNINDAIRLGIGFVPEDRKNQSLILGQSVRFNVALAGLKQLFKKGLFISNNTIDRTTSEYIKKLSIRLHSSKQAVRSLSGGNQQKVVLAKWLLLQPSVLILDEPTRGVDVGAKAEIYQLLGELVSKGITIILISSDLPELIGLSDRIVVMSEGRIVKVLEQEEATPHQVMYYAGLNEKTAEVVNERNLQP